MFTRYLLGFDDDDRQDFLSPDQLSIYYSNEFPLRHDADLQMV